MKFAKLVFIALGAQHKITLCPTDCIIVSFIGAGAIGTTFGERHVIKRSEIADDCFCQ